MKIICVYGSPIRKGNSATIANSFLDAAKVCGAEVSSYSLYDIKFSGCKACMACKSTHKKCVLEDDLSIVLEQIHEADILLISTPIYDLDVTAQMKAFIERTHSFLGAGYGSIPRVKRLPAGKKTVFTIAQGNGKDMHQEVFPKYEKLFGSYGFTESHLIRACDVIKPGEIKSQPQILDQATELANRMLCA